MNGIFVFYHAFDALGKGISGNLCLAEYPPLTDWPAIEKLQNFIRDDLNTQNMGIKGVMIQHWQRLENVTH